MTQKSAVVRAGLARSPLPIFPETRNPDEIFARTHPVATNP